MWTCGYADDCPADNPHIVPFLRTLSAYSEKYLPLALRTTREQRYYLAASYRSSSAPRTMIGSRRKGAAMDGAFRSSHTNLEEVLLGASHHAASLRCTTAKRI